MMSADGDHPGKDPNARVYLSFVVPCLNEAEGVCELHRRIDAAGRQMAGPFEIVIVDDGSSDGTWPTLRRLATEHPEVAAVRLSRSFGQQAALAAGLSVARGERVLTLDADLQDPPELVAEMLTKMDEGADVVHARRRSRTGESLFKRATAAAFYRVLNWLSDTRIEPDSGEFRLFSRRAVDVMLVMPERHRLLRGLAGWIGFRQAVVEYDRPPRALGKSKFPSRAMLRLATDAIAAFSTRPLRLASVLSLVCVMAAVAGAAGGAWGLTAARAWASFALGAALVCALAGMQLLALGVIGEYLGRLYPQSQARPLFIIDDVIANSSPASERCPAVKCPTGSEPSDLAASQS
jgi:polyisoprenyl-phosphate glycosyltransferase